MRRALLVISLALLAACGKRTEPATEAPPPAAAPAGPALQVLATSDLKDIEPLAGQIKAATGVDVQFRFGGTMESTQEVLSGDSAGKPAPDVAWFANAKYLLSDAAGQRKVKLQEKIMLSPMAVGVSRSPRASVPGSRWGGAHGSQAARDHAPPLRARQRAHYW